LEAFNTFEADDISDMVYSKGDEMEEDIHKRVRKLLGKSYAGYVLVTCKRPISDGGMQVEMTYEGDPVLAAYLLEGAQEYLDEEEGELGLELMS
jgi:hypothetical protein